LKQSGIALADADTAHSDPARLRARLLRARVRMVGGDFTGASGELPEIDRLLLAYPALELRRMRAELAKDLSASMVPKSGNVAATNGESRR
jgi:hypothetical protein